MSIVKNLFPALSMTLLLEKRKRWLKEVEEKCTDGETGKKKTIQRVARK